MPITNFTVDFVNHPDGQYKASLKGKDQNGQPLKLSMGRHSLEPFQKGQTYLIEYSVKSFKRDDGTEVKYYAFDGIVDGGPETYPGLAPTMTPVGQAAAPTAAQLREQAAKLEQAERQKASAIEKVHDDETLKAAQIFVTGVVGRAAGNGLQATDLKVYALAAVDAWNAAQAALHGKQPTPGPVQSENAAPPALEDTIPF